MKSRRGADPARTRLRLTAAVAACFLLFGCAAKGPGRAGKVEEAKTLWSAYQAREGDDGKANRAFSLSASISFTAQSKSGRLNVEFRGNPDGPFRLNLSTPVGSPYACWREDASGWRAYYPGQNLAYAHPDARKGMARLGLPFPFDLRELAAVALGRLTGFTPESYASAKRVADGIQFSFSAKAPLASMTLDFEGKPIHLIGRGVEPWQVDLQEYQQFPGQSAPAAGKIVLTTPGGAKAVMRLKKMEIRDGLWPESALEMPVPAGVDFFPLDLPGQPPVPGI